jgi:hypothetical protein
MACGADEIDNSVEFDEFAGQTGQEIEAVDSNLVDTNSGEDPQLERFTDGLALDYDTASLISAHAMDRYSYSTVKKIKFKANYEVNYGKTQKVVPSAAFYYYSFPDSAKTNNAFYNYLVVIGENGESGPVKLNQDMDAIKSPPMFMVVYDTVIISAQYKCEHAENDWNKFQDSLLNAYGKTYRYLINIECGGPLTWQH